MSFLVVVVLDDPTKDAAISTPLVRRLLEECGKPNAKVMMPQTTKGHDHAKSGLPGLVDRYSHCQLFLFLPDRDGLSGRADELRHIESTLPVLCCAAVEEIEIWLLAGHKTKLGGADWKEVRSEVSLKERYFQPFLDAHGDKNRQDKGRESLIRETLQNYRGLKDSCPELKELEKRVCEAVSA